MALTSVTSVIRWSCWMTTAGEQGAGHWQPRGDRAWLLDPSTRQQVKHWFSPYVGRLQDHLTVI